MRYASAAAFRHALETRLNEQSRVSGRSIVRLRKEVAFDRLLARLLAIGFDRWALKGALALDYRFGDRSRTTKDVDLATSSPESAVAADLATVQALDLGDHFVFEVERTDALDGLVDGAAVRYRVRADLAGRPFESFALDVGFDYPSGELDRLRGPDPLAFADIEPVEVPAISIETHVAEKLHAYTRHYGPSGIASTRVKDLVDLVLITAEARPGAGRLASAISDTFERRGTHATPDRVPKPPGDWRVPYAKLAVGIGLDPDLDTGYRLAAAMLDPFMRGEVPSGTWTPARRSWGWNE